MKHQHVLSGSIFDSNKNGSCLSDPVEGVVTARGKIQDSFNNSQLTQSKRNQSSIHKQFSKRSHVNGSQWKSVADAPNIFMPRSSTIDDVHLNAAHLHGRGNLNQVIYSLGPVNDPEKQVLLSN